MKCKRTDEFHIIKIRGRKYFTFEMPLNYENMYYNPTPTEERAFVFSASTKKTGLEKYT